MLSFLIGFGSLLFVGPKWEGYMLMAAFGSLGLGALFLFALAVQATLFRVQASLLEFMFLMIACGVPWGCMAKMIADDHHEWDGPKLFAALFFSLVSVLPLLGGAAWGLNAAKRLGEQRTFLRLGLMVLGSGLIVGLLVLPVAGIATLALFVPDDRERIWVVLSLWSVTLLTIPGLLVEARIKRRVEAMRKRPGKVKVDGV